MDIKEFAEKFIKAGEEAWRKGNFDELEKIEDPNVVYHVSPFPDLVGWEAHKQYIQGSVQMISGLWQEVKYLTGDGNLFALTYKSGGRLTSEMPGMPIPKGKEYSTDYLCLYRVKGGKLVEAWMNGSITASD
jgi:ketosteroid isomerase-like protein